MPIIFSPAFYNPNHFPFLHSSSFILWLGFEEDMKGTYCCFMLILQLGCWVSAATTAFAPNHPLLPHKQQGLVSGSLDSKQAVEGVNEEEMLYRGMRRIGSGRPRCEHKCYGCVPCEAIEVPTNNRHTHVGVQYTNYEPEGWKCKCGHSFYSP